MTVNIEEHRIELLETADIAGVIYSVDKTARKLGFNDIQRSLISSAASELATNIVRYAGMGKMFVRGVYSMSRPGVEIEALDEGPGIACLEDAMAESFSTGDGLGLGLPSVKRLMDEFYISSEKGGGTRIRAIKWKE